VFVGLVLLTSPRAAPCQSGVHQRRSNPRPLTNCHLFAPLVVVAKHVTIEQRTRNSHKRWQQSPCDVCAVCTPPVWCCFHALCRTHTTTNLALWGAPAPESWSADATPPQLTWTVGETGNLLQHAISAAATDHSVTGPRQSVHKFQNRS